MALYINRAGVWEVWHGERLPPDDILLNTVDAERLSDDELSEFGLVRPAPAAPLPEGAVPGEITIGLVDGVVSFINHAREVTIEDAKTAKLDELQTLRWEKETGGVMVRGIPIATDRESQGKITSGYVQAIVNPDFFISDWKFGRGSWSALDAATIILVGDAVTAHVQACFSRERELEALITVVDEIVELNAIDIHSGWPT